MLIKSRTNISFLPTSMANQGGGLEWRISFPDGTSRIFVSERCGFVMGLSQAWRIGANDPYKLIHCCKVGAALCLVLLFYYMRPLYEGIGGNAMWAVLTVVVAFEYTVGATICKSLNRATATLLAGALGVGVHWIADRFGQKSEPIILQASVFVLAALATFSRFLPRVKAQFDHGALLFIITFVLISVSGYRVEELLELAHHRLSTVGIGTSICILISMLFCPVWAGNELHNLIKNNMGKLADSLDECVAEYFRNDSYENNTENEASNNILMGYKCVLNSRGSEESLANFARWEPSHGVFNFGHPWQEYLQVGDSLRSCAYCINALHGIIISDTKAPDFLKKHFSKFCIKLSSSSSAVLKELVVVTNTMAKSPKIDLRIEEMCNAVKEAQMALESLYKQPIESEYEESNASPTNVSFAEITPLVTLSALLVEISARTEKIVKAVNVLAKKATSSEMGV